jgi:CRISPR-associated endonuclease Csn1
MNNLFDRDIKGAWAVDDRKRVVDIANKNTCRVVRMTESGKGALFNATIKTAGANDNLIPLKAKGAIANTSKYGGYDSATTGYFMLVKSVDKKGNSIISLETMPLYVSKLIGNDMLKKINYCTETLGLIHPEILLDNIKRNTLFCIDGSYAYVRGRTGKQVVWCNANELFLDKEYCVILKKITKYVAAAKDLRGKDLQPPEDINADDNLCLYNELINKLDSKIYGGLSIKGQVKTLVEKRDKFIALSIKEQCLIIMEVLKLMQCNSTTADLTLLGGVGRAGTILTSKIITGKDIKIIYQSPTGYYKKVINVKDLI